MRGSAMSGAPTCIGIIQLASPTKAGMTAPKIMISACMVVRVLNSAGSTNCRPGLNSSARITMAKVPPTKNMMQLNTRYSVPMSLWLVVVTQRPQKPCGLWSWASWASACSRMGHVTVLAEESFSRLLPVSGCGETCRSALDVQPSARALSRALPAAVWRGAARMLPPEPPSAARATSRNQPCCDLHHDRHEAMIASAQLGALTAIDADLVGVGVEPGLIDKARDRVLLDRQRRHPPRMDDVLARDQHAHLDAGRHHQRMIDIEQIVGHASTDRCPN